MQAKSNTQQGYAIEKILILAGSLIGALASILVWSLIAAILTGATGNGVPNAPLLLGCAVLSLLAYAITGAFHLRSVKDAVDSNAPSNDETRASLFIAALIGPYTLISFLVSWPW